ncbi:MAG: AAA family ATPase [Nitrospirae bacterium]|nr:AAA family ATPase [Nitrospirota bacterium]
MTSQKNRKSTSIAGNQGHKKKRKDKEGEALPPLLKTLVMMKIHKVEIFNYRCHKSTSVKMGDVNILIGQNNTGKTSFLQALNLAIGYKRNELSEDDYHAEGDIYDPKSSSPIKVIVEFREQKDNRFSDNVISVFDKAIQFDESSSEKPEDEPIKFFKICYEHYYDNRRDKFTEARYFVDSENIKLSVKDSIVTKDHLSFFPFFYIESLRDIRKEINNKGSFLGKIKSSISYTDIEAEISSLLSSVNDLLIKNNNTLGKLLEKLKELGDTIRGTSDTISLDAFKRRSWELLDGLDIYLKIAKTNLTLPVSKHGAGTQNVVILLIFSAFLDTMLTKVVDNTEATPIIGIEEPEAHVFPQAQRAMFHQISRMNGQKIISTHSPYIADQADIYDYTIFTLINGKTELKKIPYFKKAFKYRPGLPQKAYENYKYLDHKEEIMIKRYLKFRNIELFFSSLFVLCEGDSEKILIDHLFPYYFDKYAGQLGISIISCDGQIYSPFLKIAHDDAFKLKWIIFSDGESETRKSVERQINRAGYDYDSELKNNHIYFLPDAQDLEKYYTTFYGYKKIHDIISKSEKFNTNSSDTLDEKAVEEFLNNTSNKIIMAEELSNFIITTKCEVPHMIQMLFRKVEEEIAF